jgi:tetratricopeptide (TPR) repeat protein
MFAHDPGLALGYDVRVSLRVRLLGTLEFESDGVKIPSPSGRVLEVAVYLAARPGLRSWAELGAHTGLTRTQIEALEFGALTADLELNDQGAFLDAESDLSAYSASQGDIRALARLRGELAPGLEPSDSAFRMWLERERFEIKRVFLVALLDHAARLESENKTREAEANLVYVQKQLETVHASNPYFAALLKLELSRYHWRLNRPARTIELIQAALPDLMPGDARDAQVNLGAALVRCERLQDAIRALEVLPESGSARGWGLVHLGNAHRWVGALEDAVESADEAFSIAKLESDGHLAIAALIVKGEALLDRATIEKREPKEAVIAFGRGVGISEVLGEDASAGVLAGLAHAHALWGNKAKALEGAEKAFKRARAAKDGVSATRALLALYAATHIGSFARNALSEARLCQHRPLEMLALIAVADKERDAQTAQDALDLAEQIGARGGIERAQNLLESLKQSV